MFGPEELLKQFAEAYRRDGSADPSQYLSQVQGLDRDELEALIDAFLLRVPRQRWDPIAFDGSLAERAFGAAESTAGAEEDSLAGWSILLPVLRNDAHLKRRTVVERLASALGFAESEDRVAAYYHQMEQGLLSPKGVSNRVLEALADIVGTSATVLRRAGEADEDNGARGGEVFARVGTPEGGSARALPSLSADAMDAVDPPDELDLLFTGGG